MHGEPAQIGDSIKVVGINHFEHFFGHHLFHDVWYGAAKAEQPPRHDHAAEHFCAQQLLRFESRLVVYIVVAQLPGSDDRFYGKGEFLTQSVAHGSNCF